jgi:glucose-1-phosphate thymidylyltransferase
MKAIIAAGGSGTRLRPLTFSSNKHLLPVANKPLLLYPLEAILAVGIKDIGIVVNETRPAIEALLGDGSSYGARITYINQAKPLGLAHVVSLCEDFIAGDPFVYHLGDNIFSQGIKRPFEHFERTKPDGLLTMVEHKENFRLGVPFFDEQGNFARYVEKPQSPPNCYGIPGLYMFSSVVFEAFKGEDQIKPSARGELEVGDLYNYLVKKGLRVETEEIEGRWMDPGKFTDMLDANRYMLDLLSENEREGEISSDSKLTGTVAVSKGATITNSQIIGPVSIAADCLIDSCTIGPHVSISNNCTLKSVKLADSIVMEHSTLEGIDPVITNSMIGKNTQVTSKAGTETSLFIGDHCQVSLAK